MHGEIIHNPCEITCKFFQNVTLLKLELLGSCEYARASKIIFDCPLLTLDFQNDDFQFFGGKYVKLRCLSDIKNVLFVRF